MEHQLAPYPAQLCRDNGVMDGLERGTDAADRPASRETSIFANGRLVGNRVIQGHGVIFQLNRRTCAADQKMREGAKECEMARRRLA